MRPLLALVLAVSASAFAVRPRHQAPTFDTSAVLPDGKIGRVSSSDFQGNFLVMIFYPFDWTFVCPTELVAFSNAVKEFEEIGAKIVGISTDSHHTHLAWTRAERTNGGVGKLNYPLLADVSKDISRAYGVLVDDPKDDMYGAALRGLFIIDDKGLIRHMQINDDSVGRSVSETLRLVQAFKHADAHQGEACPANWKPGAKTIHANHEQAGEFFSTWEA